MSNNLQHLIEGYDPTGQPCITLSQLLAMVRNAYPIEEEGWIHWSVTAPDVVSYPEFESFLWGEIVAGVRTNRIYFYNGTSWQLIPLTVLDNTLTLIKFSLTGTSPRYIIQVNSAGTALVWTSIPNAIQDGEIPVSKLTSPGALGNWVLVSQAGTRSFVSIADFLNLITDNTLPTAKLIRGGAAATRQFLSTNVAGTAIEWVTLDIANILASGAAAGQTIRRNTANTGWEFTNLAGMTPVFGINTTEAATMDITINKPGTARWTAIECEFVGTHGSSAGGGTAQVDFSYQTAPEVGTVPGTGNSGTAYAAANNSAPCQLWKNVGVIATNLAANNSIILRATLTFGGDGTFAAPGGSVAFAVKGWYV